MAAPSESVTVSVRELLDLLRGDNGDTLTQKPEATLDPTKNVIDKVVDAVKRLDDLGELRFKYTTDMANLREVHAQQVGKLRAEHQSEVGHKETERLDAIRLVDTGAVTRAAEVQTAQAATLATTQATIADTLRGQVAAAATATATALATALQPITKAIEDLRQAQYQQQGERFQRTEGTATYRWVVPTAIAGAGCLVAVFGLIATIITAALTAAWLHSLHVF